MAKRVIRDVSGERLKAAAALCNLEYLPPGSMITGNENAIINEDGDLVVEGKGPDIECLVRTLTCED